MFSGVKSFLTVLNNEPVIDAIKNLHGHNKAKSIMCFDFSTFYKNIPHDKLIRVLSEHIDFCFKVGNWIFSAVGA